jgi:hypothetical protein
MDPRRSRVGEGIMRRFQNSFEKGMWRISLTEERVACLFTITIPFEQVLLVPLVCRVAGKSAGNRSCNLTE